MKFFGRKTWLVLLLTLILVSLARAEMEGGIPVGDTGQDVTVEPLGVAPTKLSALQANRPILFVVFQDWCPHCQEAVSTMNAVYAKLDLKKVAMVAVAPRQDAGKVRAFQQRFGAKYPLAADATGQVMRPYNIQAVPSFFIMDKGRVVRFNGHEATVDEFVGNLNSLVAHP